MDRTQRMLMLRQVILEAKARRSQQSNRPASEEALLDALMLLSAEIAALDEEVTMLRWATMNDPLKGAVDGAQWMDNIRSMVAGLLPPCPDSPQTPA